MTYGTCTLQILATVLQLVHISVYAQLSVVALLLGYGETPVIWRTIFIFLHMEFQLFKIKF